MNWKKYKYLTSKDLGYKPGVDIEYSALGKIFNKVLEENSKKNGIRVNIAISKVKMKKNYESRKKAIKSD